LNKKIRWVTDAETLELIRWLMDLEDKAAIRLFKVAKNQMGPRTDWGNTISEKHVQEFWVDWKDVANIELTPHTEVKKVYGL